MENFEFVLNDESSVLLIGRNGSGKSTVGAVLRLFQQVAQGTNRVSDLISPGDLSKARGATFAQFEITARLGSEIFTYSISFELPDGFKELRIKSERLVRDGAPVYERELGEVRLYSPGRQDPAEFRIDWHVAALPIIQGTSQADPISTFRDWLAALIILQPIPRLITGDSETETLRPSPHATNFGDWFSGVLAHAPAAYAQIDAFLRLIMPDLVDIKDPVVAKDARSIVVQFAQGSSASTFHLPFRDLSDGEKCYFIAATLLAANQAYGPLVCFWDEPDGHLAISEVGQFVLALRNGFRNGGQFIATSHNSQAIHSFSNSKSFVLSRCSHA